jgi:hypothetical protein
MASDQGSHCTFVTFERWDAEQTQWVKRRSGLAEPDAWYFRRLGVKPYSVTEHEGNLVTDAGWNLMMKNTAGSAGTLFSATVGRIGVGDSSTAPAYGDTALNASTNKQYKLISAAPTVGSTHSTGLVFSATFGTSQANFAWNEFGTDQGTADGTTVTAVFFNHGVSSQGTKASGQTWAVTETITWS